MRCRWVRARLRVAAAANYRERSWPPSQSVCGIARCESAQFAARKPARMVVGPNYHQPGADLRVRLRVVRPPLRGAGRLARRASRSPRSSAPSAARTKVERLLSTSYAPLHRQMTPNQRRRLEDKRGTDRGGAKERFKRAARGREARGRAAERRWIVSDAEARREALVEVYNEASVCERCPLSETRNRVVFGAGNADADLMFVGEAPGAEEDRQGLPFVGRAGGFLTELLEGIGLKREDVFIANVLKCRPPGQPRPPAGGDRLLPALPREAGRADPAAGDRHARATSPPSCSPPTRPGSPRFAARRRST